MMEIFELVFSLAQSTLRFTPILSIATFEPPDQMVSDGLDSELIMFDVVLKSISARWRRLLASQSTRSRRSTSATSASRGRATPTCRRARSWRTQRRDGGQDK